MHVNFPFKINEHWEPLHSGADHSLIYNPFLLNGRVEGKKMVEDFAFILCVSGRERKTEVAHLSIPFAVSSSSLLLREQYCSFALFTI